MIDCSEEWYIPQTRAQESLGLPSPRTSLGRSPTEILRGRPTQALPSSCWWYIILFNSIFGQMFILQRKNLEGMIIPSRFLCGGMIIPSWFLRGGMVKPSQFLKTVRYSIQATLSLLWLKHLPCKPPLKYQIF